MTSNKIEFNVSHLPDDDLKRLHEAVEIELMDRISFDERPTDIMTKKKSFLIKNALISVVTIMLVTSILALFSFLMSKI